MNEQKRRVRNALVAVMMIFAFVLSGVAVSLIGTGVRGISQVGASAIDSGLPNITGMAHDGEFVYLVSDGSPVVKRYDKRTGEIVTSSRTWFQML